MRPGRRVSPVRAAGVFTLAAFVVTACFPDAEGLVSAPTETPTGPTRDEADTGATPTLDPVFTDDDLVGGTGAPPPSEEPGEREAGAPPDGGGAADADAAADASAAPPACRPVQQACTDKLQCCPGRLCLAVAGAATLQCCVVVGDGCSSSGQCCGNRLCSPRGCCVRAGDGCARDDQCCSNQCTGSKCVAE